MNEARELVDDLNEPGLRIERSYEPDDAAIARAVAILLRQEPQEGHKGEAA